MRAPDFATFVGGEGPRLPRFATLLTGSVTAAEDLVQTCTRLGVFAVVAHLPR